jgi:uncharacterized membrane protein YhaH (DUF805 family)
MEWYLGVLKKYAEFNGRARRKEYWMFFLVNVIISMGIGFVVGFIGGMLGLGAGVSSGLSSLYSLAVLCPAIAVGIRRMHDTNHSGWWLLVPLVNLIFACTEGTPGPNEYGPNPKGV